MDNYNNNISNYKNAYLYLAPYKLSTLTFSLVTVSQTQYLNLFPDNNNNNNSKEKIQTERTRAFRFESQVQPITTNCTYSILMSLGFVNNLFAYAWKQIHMHTDRHTQKIDLNTLKERYQKQIYYDVLSVLSSVQLK